MSNPAPSALTLPRLPPGMITQSGHLPVELLHDLDRRRVFWPSSRSEFIEFAR